MKPVDQKVLTYLQRVNGPVLLSDIVKNADIGRVDPVKLIKRLMDAGMVVASAEPYSFVATQKARRALVGVPDYSRDTAKHAIWTLIRMSRKFTVDDIVQDLPDSKRVSRRFVNAYLKALEAVGYLGDFGRVSSLRGGAVTRYILLVNSGVKAPETFNGVDGVYDHNLKPKECWIVPATNQTEVA